MLSGDRLTARMTVRFSKDEIAAINEAARLFGVEPGRLVRKAVAKALRDLAPDLEKRRQVPSESLL